MPPKGKKRTTKRASSAKTRVETRAETLEPLSETRENMPETRENDSEAQAIEAYACSCGLIEPDLNQFKGHQMSTHADRENHQSLGRINTETGEIVMPPAKDRTKEQWAEAKYGKKPELSERSSSPSTASKVTPQQPEAMQRAMQIRFVPRIYTIDYSPILRAAQDASIEFWRWPADMSLGDFIDTVLHMFFKEKGITLVGYIVEETEEERQRREAIIKEKTEVVA